VSLVVAAGINVIGKKGTEYSGLQQLALLLWDLCAYGITQCYLPLVKGAECHSCPYPSQLKLVLDFMTIQTCKAELTGLYTEVVFTHPSTNPAQR